MTQSSCDMAPVVEALHDARLGEREAASVERHLASCASCRELRESLSRLRALARTPGASRLPLEHQRGRVRLLQRAAAPRRPSPVSVRRFVVAPLAAAALLLLAIGLFWPAPRALLAASAGLEERARVVELAQVKGSEGAVFSRERSFGVEVVTLATGSVYVSVRPLGVGQRFLVRTTDAEVEVRGTKFSVEAEQGLIRSVAVEEGKVEVRHQGVTTLLLPGEAWRPPAAQVAASAFVPAPGPAGGAAAQSAATRGPKTQAADAAPVDVPVAPQGDASEMFRQAVGALEDGDYGAANGRLERFAAEHPDDVRAEDAAFLRILALKRAGREDEAAEAARGYLARFPEGFRRAEAAEIVRGSQVAR